MLDKEAFPRLGGKLREGDLVYRARMRHGEEVYFLIHLEHQAQHQSNFSRRFRYFFLFHDKHDLAVYPVALLSYQTSRRKAASSYRVAFPNFEPLGFPLVAIATRLEGVPDGVEFGGHVPASKTLDDKRRGPSGQLR